MCRVGIGCGIAGLTAGQHHGSAAFFAMQAIMARITFGSLRGESRGGGERMGERQIGIVCVGFWTHHV